MIIRIFVWKWLGGDFLANTINLLQNVIANYAIVDDESRSEEKSPDFNEVKGYNSWGGESDNTYKCDGKWKHCSAKSPLLHERNDSCIFLIGYATVLRPGSTLVEMHRYNHSARQDSASQHS